MATDWTERAYRIEEEHPGVAPAYGLVLTAYDFAIRRLDVIEGRIGALVTVIIGLTTGIPTLVRGMGLDADPSDPEFLAALACGALAAFAGLAARNQGRVTMIDLPTLWRDRHVDKPEIVFKNDVLYWACRHYEKNVELVRIKAAVLDWMTVFLVVEGGLLLGWVL